MTPILPCSWRVNAGLTKAAVEQELVHLVTSKFWHFMTYRQVHSSNIKLKMKHQLRQSVHSTFHSWTWSHIFSGRQIIFLLLWNNYPCSLKLLFPWHGWNTVFKVPLFCICTEMWSRMVLLFWIINAIMAITSCNSFFIEDMYSDMQNITITSFAYKKKWSIHWLQFHIEILSGENWWKHC